MARPYVGRHTVFACLCLRVCVYGFCVCLCVRAFVFAGPVVNTRWFVRRAVFTAGKHSVCHLCLTPPLCLRTVFAECHECLPHFQDLCLPLCLPARFPYTVFVCLRRPKCDSQSNLRISLRFESFGYTAYSPERIDVARKTTFLVPVLSVRTANTHC